MLLSFLFKILPVQNQVQDMLDQTFCESLYLSFLLVDLRSFSRLCSHLRFERDSDMLQVKSKYKNSLRPICMVRETTSFKMSELRSIKHQMLRNTLSHSNM